MTGLNDINVRRTERWWFREGPGYESRKLVTWREEGFRVEGRKLHIGGRLDLKCLWDLERRKGLDSCARDGS